MNKNSFFMLLLLFAGFVSAQGLIVPPTAAGEAQDNFTNASYVPYEGALQSVYLGDNDLHVNTTYVERIGILDSQGCVPIGNHSSQFVGSAFCATNVGTPSSQFINFVTPLNFTATGASETNAFMRTSDSFGGGSSILKVWADRMTYDEDFYLIGNLDMEGFDITVDNVCYSNGTNCQPAGASYDQDLNTYNTVQFNGSNVVPQYDISEGGYSYGLVGDIDFKPSTGMFYDIFRSTGTSIIDAPSYLVPRVFYNGRNYDVYDIAFAKILTFHNAPVWDFHNSKNITYIIDYSASTTMNTINGSSTVPDYIGYEATPRVSEAAAGDITVDKWTGFSVGNLESNGQLNLITNTPTISELVAYNFDPVILAFTSSRIPKMTGLNLEPSGFVAFPDEYKAINIGDLASGTYEGIKSVASASGNSKQFINHTGTAPSHHEGNFTFGETQFFTAPNSSVYECGPSNAGVWSCTHT